MITIYCYHCIPTGKKYVGQTINEIRRKKQHRSHALAGRYNMPFHRAIRKYGWDSFTYGVIEHTDDDTREAYWIDKLGTLSEGYNATTGGKSFKHTEETKEKMRWTQQRRIRLEGRVFTEESRKKISDTHKGKIVREESIQKNRDTRLKNKLREGKLGAYCSLEWLILVERGLVKPDHLKGDK